MDKSDMVYSNYLYIVIIIYILLRLDFKLDICIYIIRCCGILGSCCCYFYCCCCWGFSCVCGWIFNEKVI